MAATTWRSATCVLLVALVVALPLGDASAAPPLETGKLFAPDSAAGDRFGDAVAITGDLLAVGSPFDDDAGTDSGSAHIYHRTPTGWQHEAKLLPPDGDPGDVFGESVSISGDTVIVGSRLDDDFRSVTSSNAGSAYIFVRSGSAWIQQAKLHAPDGAAEDWFGISVAVHGDVAVVGSMRDDDKGSDTGSAYVFTRSGTVWSFAAKLVPSDAAQFDEFGRSVAAADDIVVVGSRGDDDHGANCGSAYVFARSGATWIEQAKLVPSDGASQDFFGIAVAASDDLVVVGSYGDDDRGTNSGSAYVYAKTGDTWSSQGKLLASDGAADDLFGLSVAAAPGTIVVGALQAGGGGPFSGGAYVFTPVGTSWHQQAKLLPGDIASGDIFGSSVSVSGSTIAVGSERDEGSGSVSIFQRPADADSDGLSDDDELEWQTKAADPDSDDDGVRDGDEVHIFATDPLDPDSDEDGLADGDELTNLTDPLDPDSDDDGLSDGDEVHDHGTLPLDGDTDGDGFGDGLEVSKATDPKDPTSFPIGEIPTLPDSPDAAFVRVQKYAERGPEGAEPGKV